MGGLYSPLKRRQGEGVIPPGLLGKEREALSSEATGKSLA